MFIRDKKLWLCLEAHKDDVLLDFFYMVTFFFGSTTPLTRSPYVGCGQRKDEARKVKGGGNKKLASRKDEERSQSIPGSSWIL